MNMFEENLEKKDEENLNLKKVCELAEIDLPEEYKEYETEKISHLIFDISKLQTFEDGTAVFMFSESPLDERKMLIKAGAENKKVFIFTRKQIPDLKCIVCDNPWEVGAQAGRYIRNKSKATFIGVTGSVGKTSTKEMIESVIKTSFGDKLIASKGNSNTIYKVIKLIDSLDGSEEVVLQEVCAGGFVDKKYNELCEFIIGKSSKIYNADIAIYTNIKDSHIESFGSREKIVEEKTKLSKYGKPDGLAIINYDDKLLRKQKFKQKTISYSLKNKKATYYAKNIEITEKGTSFILVDTILKRKLEIQISAIGEHNVLNAIVAYAVGKYLGETDSEIIKGLKAYKTSGIRQNLINVGKYKILADCYNSSYDALNNILNTFKILQTDGRKIAVIGDIFELGDISIEIHKKVGKLLAKFKLDKVFFIGENSLYSYKEYNKIKDNGVYCTSREELINGLTSYIKRKDIILFKASHGMQFGELIDTIFGLDIGEKQALGHKEYNIDSDEEFVYQIFENHVTIKEYLKNEEVIEIKEKYKELNIEKLARKIFEDNKTIKEIILSDNIKSLKGSCFKNSSLEKITFGKGLRKIGENTFDGCNLKEAILPEGILMIRKDAFSNMNNLEKVVIPRTCQLISKSAFQNTNNVTLVVGEKSYGERYAKTNGIKYEYFS